ncbi:MAG: hypothetical protein ACRC1K_09080 [Planctomycetia bacterium]
MNNPPPAVRPRRVELRNLDLPTKALVFVLLAGAGFGYLAALVNLFTAHAGADGRQTVKVEELGRLVREKGVAAAVKAVGESLGMDDVVKHYHGSGYGVTQLEAKLNGSMRDMLFISYGVDDAETRDLAEKQRLQLIEWSHLPQNLRKKAYETGMPMNPDTGLADFKKFTDAFGGDKPDPKKAEELELDPSAIAGLVEQACIECHAAGSPDPTASRMLLETYQDIEKYCSEDHGVSYQALALTTHNHLFGFLVVFGLTGFLVSMTSWPAAFRFVAAPLALTVQLVEVACWWLAKGDVFYAQAIFYLGGAVGAALALQIFSTLLDLMIRRRDPA